MGAREQRQRTTSRDPGDLAHPFEVDRLVFAPRYGFGRVVVALPELARVRFPTRSDLVDFHLPDDWHDRRLLTQAELERARRGDDQEPPRQAEEGAASSLGALIEELYAEALEDFPGSSPERYTFRLHEPATVAAPGGVNEALAPELSRALAALGVEQLYAHQLAADQALRLGNHTLLCTPTASGKTLAYAPWVFQRLLEDSEATALFLFPLVALSEDQQAKLRQINGGLPPNRQLEIGIYTGALDAEERRRVKRQNNRMLVTTPDSLHGSFLRNDYANWRRFFHNLRCVVLDEAHLYKGAFGTHVAAIIRRLQARCRSCGSQQRPQFVVSSATIANPRDLASRLTGLAPEAFALIDRSGAAVPPRHSLSLVGDTVEICHRLASVRLDDGDGARRLKTIVFCRSIRRVHDLAGLLRRRLEAEGRAEDARRVRVYYSRAKPPRELLREMSSIDVLFCTTALMAGIDVGELDVCVVEGFPGLLMDLRQMFGRAGRRREGASLFVGRRSSVFDEHYLQRPREIFFGEPERAVLNPANPSLLAAHLRCAAHHGTAPWDREGPLRTTALSGFGPAGQRAMQRLVDDGEVLLDGARYVHTGAPPHFDGPLEDLRGAGEAEYQVVDDRGRVLLRRSERYAHRDFHPEAIFELEGRLFHVDDLDPEALRVRARPITDDRLRTRGLVEIDVFHQGEPERRSQRSAEVSLGDLRLERSLRQYVLERIELRRICRGCGQGHAELQRRQCPRCGRSLRLREERRPQETRPVKRPGGQPLDLSLSLSTVGCWLTPTAEMIERFDRELWPRPTAAPDSGGEALADLTLALSTLSGALLHTVAERIICDPSDVDALVLPAGPDGPRPHLYLFDDYPGGLGIAAEVFLCWRPMLEAALARIEGCTCNEDRGCPVCVLRYGAWHEAPSKLAARYLLLVLLDRDPAPVLDDLRRHYGG